MATTFSEIVKAAMTIIDDVRDKEQLSLNPAAFYRRYSGYVEHALPLLSRPPELYNFLRGNAVYATYTDSSWTSTAASMSAETQVDTLASGFDLCSIVQISADGSYMTPYTDFDYDKDSGIVTFGVQSAADVVYEINFYNDGYIDGNLTPTQIRLFALAIAVIWNERFTNNWLNLQPKIKDRSFSTVNESGYMGKLTERSIAVRQEFQDELRKYEQDMAYAEIYTVNGSCP